MKKRYLPVIMVITIFMLFPSFLPNAAATFPNCTSSTLTNSELWVSATGGFLYKVHGTDGQSCVYGLMVLSTGEMAADVVVVSCDDIALDHPTGKIYCLRDGNSLYLISLVRVASVANPGSFELLASPVTGNNAGGILKLTGDPAATCGVGGVLALCPLTVVNSLEIDAAGVAYAVAGGAQALGFGNGGKLMTLDLSTAILTLRTQLDIGISVAASDRYRSAGDLAINEQAVPKQLFLTVKCNVLNAFAGGTCADPNSDALVAINLIGAGADVVTSITDLTCNDALCGGAGTGNDSGKDVFAMEYIGTGSSNLCFLSMSGFIFETDLTGNRIAGDFPKNGAMTSVFGTGLSIPAFGATANFVGGSLIMIDKIALVVAGIETNAAWLILFMIASVAVVAFQFTGKTNTRKSKNINH